MASPSCSHACCTLYFYNQCSVDLTVGALTVCWLSVGPEDMTDQPDTVKKPSLAHDVKQFSQDPESAT